LHIAHAVITSIIAKNNSISDVSYIRHWNIDIKAMKQHLECAIRTLI